MTATPLPPAELPPRGGCTGLRCWLARRGLGVGGLVPVVLLTFAPKCVLCLLAYSGLGAALGFGGRELCGATTSPIGLWLAWLPLLGLAGAAAWTFVRGHWSPGLATRGIK